MSAGIWKRGSRDTVGLHCHDGLTSRVLSARVLSEVKNGGSLSYTQQLRDLQHSLSRRADSLMM